MKVLFNIGNYKNIDVIPELSFCDQMDGTPDTMSLSFIYGEDITDKVKLKDYCYVTIEDDIHNIKKVGKLSYDSITIGEDSYVIIDGSIYSSSDTENALGIIKYDYKELSINSNKYLYYEDVSDISSENVDLYEDNRKYYYMCLSQISSDLNSLAVNNGYTITASLKEQTMWLKDCIKSDLTITPSLYPEINEEKIYPTLLEAVYKICDRHNMHLLNYKILEINEELKEKLSSVVCPNLTYKDLSTFDQLYDILMRIGQMPYFENGILYGIPLTGNQKSQIIDLTSYVSSMQSVREEGINQNVYSTKVYNNVYDTETLVVPSIFQGIDTIEYFFTRKIANKTDEEWAQWLRDEYQKWTFLNSKNETDSKRLLGVSNYDYLAYGSENATNYPLILPSNIEYVTSVRKIEPIIRYSTRTEQDGTENGVMEFGFKQYAIGYSMYLGTHKIDDVLDNKFSLGEIDYTIKNDGGVYVDETLVNKVLRVFLLNNTPYRIMDNKLYSMTSWEPITEISNNSFALNGTTYYIIDDGLYEIVSDDPNAINGSVINNVVYDDLFGITAYGNPLVEVGNTMSHFYSNISVINSNGEFYLNGHTYKLSTNYSITRDDLDVGLWTLGQNNSTTIIIGGTSSNGTGITGGTFLKIIIIGNRVYDYNYRTGYPFYDGKYSIRYDRNFEFAILPDENGNNGALESTQMPGYSENWSFVYTNSVISPVKASLDIYNEPNILEYSAWSKLEKLQQNQFAYYNVGENKINQPLAFVAPKNELNGSLPLSDKVLYDYLKESFFIVKYKPMLNQEYINYDYSLQSDGAENVPVDVNSYTLPYKSVSDKQVYPLLEYNLNKGLEETTTIKIVSTNKELLDLSASNIVKVNGKKYVINSIEFNIDNRSIEASIQMSQEIIINSILSSYKDNIRVSSNLSTEETVNAIFPILSEEVITLEQEADQNYLNNIGDDNSYFSQDLGVMLAKGGYNDLNMNDGFSDQNIYRYMTKYPLRFGKIKNINVADNEINYSFVIKANTDFPFGDGLFAFNTFPIYAREIHYSTTFGTSTKRTITINSYDELLYHNDNTFYISSLANNWFGYWANPYWFAYWEFSSDGDTWTEVRPERWELENDGVDKGTTSYYGRNQGWSILNGLSFKYVSLEKSSPKGVLVISEGYDGDNSEFDTRQVYCTEGFFTQSGFISSYQYLINDPVSLLTRYLPSNQLDYGEYISDAKYYPGRAVEISDAFVNSSPIFFNTSNNGCELLGFGEQDSANYNTSIFPTLSNNYGFKIDIREIPSVYLQYKTIMRDSGYAKLKELSSDIKWMSQSVWGISSLKPRLIKFKNHMRIDDLNINQDNISDYLVDDSLTKNLNGYILSEPINEPIDSDYDYAIILASDDYSRVKRVFRFSINGINNFDRVYISIKIKNSYETIQHNN